MAYLLSSVLSKISERPRPMVSMLFRDSQALSSTLASLGMPQPQVFGSLNHVETLDSASNYYLEKCMVVIHVYMYLQLFINTYDIALFLGRSQ